MNVNVGRKRDLIRITEKILRSEGREGLSIRRIASEAGCTSAVIYKHFDNLDHLIMMASVQFLEPYMNRMAAVSARKDLTGVQMNLILWKEFLREAFANKDYYEMMFIGAGRNEMRTCVEEYYRIFSEEFDDVDPVAAAILFSNSLEEREYIRLRQAEENGCIKDEDARALSRLAEAVFIGRLTQFDGSGSPEEAAEECYQLIYDMYEKYAGPQTVLDA